MRLGYAGSQPGKPRPADSGSALQHFVETYILPLQLVLAMLGMGTSLSVRDFLQVAREARRPPSRLLDRTLARIHNTVMSTIDRREILDAASHIVAREGAAMLSMRRLARELGASTMVVYTHFGDKRGLIEAIIAEAFRRFASTLRGSQTHADPWARLHALGLAYRRFALDNPSYYALMWRRGAWEGLPSQGEDGEAHRHGQTAFGILIETVTRVLASLGEPADRVEPAAIYVWSTVHGFVSLELVEELPRETGDALYEQTLARIARGLGRTP